MHQIDADFRTVLKCLRVLNDPDVDQRDALFLLMQWFFKGAFVSEGLQLFSAFVSDGEEEDGYDPKMDFEQDADAIYASFLSEYGIDLLDVDYMHWSKFIALLGGLSEHSALQGRIQLREMDVSKLKGKERMKAEKAKRRVALVERMSAEDEALARDLETALAEGRDPSAILARFKDL